MHSGSDCRCGSGWSGFPERDLGSERSAPATRDCGRIAASTERSGGEGVCRAQAASGERRHVLRSDHVVRRPRHATHPHHALSIRDTPRRRFPGVHPWLVSLASRGRSGGRRCGSTATADDGLSGGPLGRRYPGHPHRRSDRCHRAGCGGNAAFGADDADGAVARPR